ncbi:YsnF/AvaK domain-containing protein [Carnobacterium sp. CS13]|nr:YsnF/AvaK domain-containing protein [Carnobacterium sp. CS13]
MGYQADEEVLGTYKEDIENGKIIVLVDDFDDEKGAVDFEGATPNAASVPPVSDDLDQGKEKIDLKAERLDVDTKEVQTGEVTVDKTVTEEMKTIEVPVKHEEITVERHPVTDGETVEGSLDMKDEEITIPVKEEQIEVTKRPVVTEEVTIGKDTTEEVKQVSEQVRKEDLDIHTSGDVEVNDEDESKKNL